MQLTADTLMNTAFLMLYFNGMVGSADAIWYHIIKFKLHKRRVTHWEHLSHIVRDSTYLVLILLMMTHATGKWWMAYPIVAAIDFTNSFIDCMMEPHTRKTLGGIPPGEYRMHTFLVSNGAMSLIVMLWATVVGGYASQPDGLTWSPLQLPYGLSVLPYMGLALSLGFALFDLFGFIRVAYGRITGQEEQVDPPAAFRAA